MLDINKANFQEFAASIFRSKFLRIYMEICAVVSMKRASDRDKIQCRLGFPREMNLYDSPVISYGT